MAKRKEPGFRISLFWEQTGGLEEGGMEDVRDIRIARKPTVHEMNLIELGVTILAAKLGLVSELELRGALVCLKVIEKKNRKSKDREVYWEAVRLIADGTRAILDMEGKR